MWNAGRVAGVRAVLDLVRVRVAVVVVVRVHAVRGPVAVTVRLGRSEIDVGGFADQSCGHGEV